MGTAQANPSKVSSPLPLWNPSSSHSVQFYEDDSFLVERVADLIATAIATGTFAVIIATKDHQEALAPYLASRGIDLASAVAKGQTLLVDSDELLAKHLVKGRLDFSRLTPAVESLLDHLGAPDRRMVIFGEMVVRLWSMGRRDDALAVERLWNSLAERYDFQLCCAYPMALFDQEQDDESLRKICSEHSRVVPVENFIATASDDHRLRSVLLLQQKARALETEVRERAKTQRALEQREAQLNDAEHAVHYLAAIVESSEDAIISKNLNGIISSWNKAAERVLGYRAEEVIGKPIILLIPPELRHEETVILSKLRAGERIDHYQTVRLHKNGSRIDVSLTISPVKDRRGNVIGAAKILRDNTLQKQMEQSLHTSERLASVGRLAATIAHEINNPLEAVTNFIYLARHQPELSPDTRDYLSNADEELARVAHIVQQTLAFYRDNSRPASRAVSAVVADVLAIYERKCRYKNLRIVRRLEAGLTICTMQGELKQVLSNLIANAIDASKDGGRILIRARSARNLKSGEPGIRLTIADYGSGISPQSRERLFIPFFTTKKEVGNGLGLWISRDLIEKGGGNIRFRSSDSAPSGTVMSIYLPLIPPQSSSSLAAEDAPAEQDETPEIARIRK